MYIIDFEREYWHENDTEIDSDVHSFLQPSLHEISPDSPIKFDDKEIHAVVY